MPGVSINGSVHVENQGKSQAWIRLKADVAIEDQEGNLLPETISKIFRLYHSLMIKTGKKEKMVSGITSSLLIRKKKQIHCLKV